MYAKEETQSLSIVKGKPIRWKLEKIKTNLNSRDWSETPPVGFDLIPKIVKANGILEDIEVYFPEKEFWKSELVRCPYTNELVNVSEKDHDQFVIGVKGHCRLFAASEIVSHPSQYSEVLVDKMKLLQVVPIQGTFEDIKRYAFDDGERTNLLTWNVVKHVIRMLKEGRSLKEIILDNPKYYYEHLRGNDGIAIYNKIMEENDGGVRAFELVDNLRNAMETHIRVPFQLGRDAFTNQLILWWKIRKNGRPATDEEKEALILNMSQGVVAKFRTLYNTCKKSNLGWRPLLRIEPVNQELIADNVHCVVNPKDGNKFFLVEGGHPDFRDALLKNACEVSVPLPKKRGPGPLSKSIIEDVINACESEGSRMMAEYVGLSKIAINSEGESWAAIDHNNASLEATRKTLQLLKNENELHPTLEAAINAVTDVKTASKTAENIKATFLALNEALGSPATNKKSPKKTPVSVK